MLKKNYRVATRWRVVFPPFEYLFIFVVCVVFLIVEFPV